MAKALIICVAGMSSSLMAQKTTDYFKTQGKDITVEAISSNALLPALFLSKALIYF